jgi:hypothetical protein
MMTRETDELTDSIRNELIKKIKTLKQNFTSLKSSRNEAKNYIIFIDNKKNESEKSKAANELFTTIKNDLEKKKNDKIEDYEEFYKNAQDESKGKSNQARSRSWKGKSRK